MNALILGVLICVLVVLYAIWRTQLETLRVLRQINVKVLNAALFEATDNAMDLPGRHQDQRRLLRLLRSCESFRN